MTLTWDEAWRKTTDIEVEEWEVRDAFGLDESEPITGDQLYEYLEDIQNAGEGIPWITGNGMEGYDFLTFELVKIHTDRFGSSDDYLCFCIGLSHHRDCPKWAMPF
ncbi:hypothetical protein OG474_30220 [Kribbella sp. NBC_01505]|uniref:hypothetical protein n=1 Tax=Kribbella sp. NBC_01505 TaxID=2903580 RepID=UPI00386F0FDB